MKRDGLLLKWGSCLVIHKNAVFSELVLYKHFLIVKDQKEYGRAKCAGTLRVSENCVFCCGIVFLCWNLGQC